MVLFTNKNIGTFDQKNIYWYLGVKLEGQSHYESSTLCWQDHVKMVVTHSLRLFMQYVVTLFICVGWKF